YKEEYLNPTKWTVNLKGRFLFSAFASPKLDLTYRWTIKSEKKRKGWAGLLGSRVYDRIIISNSPDLTLADLPHLGTYSVTLEVFNSSSSSLGKMSENITLKDYLIVLIGDSMASGEGNPDRPGEANDEMILSTTFLDIPYDCSSPKLIEKFADGQVFMNVSPIWLEPNAHRSERAGGALAAKELEDSSDKSSVTFVTFGTSGAELIKGLFSPQNSRQPKGQLDEVKDARQVAKRDIDLLMVSIGGNDLGFSDMLKKAILENVYNENIYSDILTDLSILAENLSAVRQKINSELRTKKVLFFSYPTDLFSMDTKVIAGPFFNVTVSTSDCGLFNRETVDLLIRKKVLVDGVNPNEAKMFKQLTEQLNATLATNILKFNETDGDKWDFLGNVIPERFNGRGYCTSEGTTLFVYASDSCEQQGDLNGTMHPNAEGHRIYKEEIFKKMKSYFQITP
ncbi:MAG: hypothetical protein ACOYXT_01115, partial [Bacteroidota bacterium]